MVPTNTVSRRNLLKAAALGTFVAGAAVSTAVANEAASASYTFADTVRWDAEYDVVVLGMGFSGMVSAMTAADHGASVLLCEKMDEGRAGGNSKVCGQMFVYSDGDVQAAMDYYTALAADCVYPEGVLEAYAEGVATMYDTMSETFGMNREEFMSVTGLPYLGMMSPEYPEMPGSSKITLNSVHDGQSDSFLYQSMKARLTDLYADKVDVWYDTPGLDLVQDPASKAIVGVHVQRHGEDRNVRARNGVCVCTGGFECDAEMVQTYLNVVNYAAIGGQFNTGDGIKMCQAVGAKLWHMTAYEGNFDMNGCGYHTPEGAQASTIVGPLQSPVNTGATIIVGDWGKRFQDESLAPRHGHMPDGNGIWENPAFPMHPYVIWDQQQMDTINQIGMIKPDYAGAIQQCATVADAAAVIGCTEEQLAQTLDDFAFFAECGRDYEFNRAADTMRAFDGVAYYVMPLRNLILNTQGGPQKNAQAQVVAVDGAPIPHLYVAGECGGITARMYQGGSNVAECFIFGQLAGANAAAPKDDLPAYEATQPVTCAPAHLGDETDLGALPDFTGPEGSVVAYGQGIGGAIPVAVTIGEDGVIQAVEVGPNDETLGIGSNAIATMPEQFVGLSTAEEIDAVDGVSGATITSTALKDAVKEALGL